LDIRASPCRGFGGALVAAPSIITVPILSDEPFIFSTSASLVAAGVELSVGSATVGPASTISVSPASFSFLAALVSVSLEEVPSTLVYGQSAAQFENITKGEKKTHLDELAGLNSAAPALSGCPEAPEAPELGASGTAAEPSGAFS
jgi:hypothetical protein